MLLKYIEIWDGVSMYDCKSMPSYTYCSSTTFTYY